MSSSTSENGVLRPILEGRHNPFALSLDYIGHNLYWVEGVSGKLCSVTRVTMFVTANHSHHLAFQYAGYHPTIQPL